MTAKGRIDLHDGVLPDRFAQAAKAPTFFYSQKSWQKVR
jgi:hypothetical protein